MKKSILLATFILFSFITVLAQQQPDPESGSWTNAAPADAGFSILMPGKASETVAPVGGRKDLENHNITLETKMAGYVFSFVEFPDEVTDPAAVKILLDNGRDGGVAAAKGELTSEKEIKLGEHFGREWAINVPGGLSTIGRAYWVKRRLYQMFFVSAPSASDTPDLVKRRDEAAAKFLNSFALSDGRK